MSRDVLPRINVGAPAPSLEERERESERRADLAFTLSLIGFAMSSFQFAAWINRSK